MKKIMVDNVTGGKLELGVVRYFTFNNNKYLIYSLDEKEEQGLIKLYVGKVSTIIENISNDIEWEQIRELIKRIIKEINENNLKCIIDLPEDDGTLNELDLISSKAFRLPIFMAQLLETKKQFANNELSNPSVIQHQDAEKFNHDISDELEMKQIKPITPGDGLERHFQTGPIINQSIKPDLHPNVVDSGAELESQTISTNYQELYLKERETNRLLNEKINEYKQKMESIRGLIDSIE